MPLNVCKYSGGLKNVFALLMALKQFDFEMIINWNTSLMSDDWLCRRNFPASQEKERERERVKVQRYNNQLLWYDSSHNYFSHKVWKYKLKGPCRRPREPWIPANNWENVKSRMPTDSHARLKDFQENKRKPSLQSAGTKDSDTTLAYQPNVCVYTV